MEPTLIFTLYKSKLSVMRKKGDRLTFLERDDVIIINLLCKYARYYLLLASQVLATFYSSNILMTFEQF